LYYVRKDDFLKLALQGHFALDVIKRMIHTSPDQRPRIAEISKALPDPSIGELKQRAKSNKSFKNRIYGGVAERNRKE